MDTNNDEVMKRVLLSMGMLPKTVDDFIMQMKKTQQKYKGLTDQEIKLIEAKIKADEEYAERIADGSKKIADGGKQLGSTLLNAVKGLGSMVNSVAASDQSFTALSPVVGMIGNVAKGVTEALGKMASGVSILGNSTGRISEGVAQIVGIGIDLVTAAVQQQLEAAQRLVNNYQNLSKVGATFGGSLTAMQKAAANGGMSIDTFTKFVTKNAESLSVLGGSVTAGAQTITKYGKTIIGQDKKLLAMYGSYDEVNGAIADYIALQARYGANTIKTQNELAAGAREYLYNQKELSELTGKSADALKKEDEERAKSAAFQLAMVTKSENEKENIRRAMQLADMQGGKDAQAYLQELIANNGRIISQSGLQFAATNGELAKTLRGYATMTNQDQASFRKQSAQFTADRADINRREQEGHKSWFQMQASGHKDQAGIFEQTNRVAAAQLGNYTKLKNAAELQANLEDKRKKGIDAGTQTYTDTIDSLEGFKQKMDAITASRLKDMPVIMNKLYGVAEKSAEALDDLGGAIDKLITGMDKALKKLKEHEGDSSEDETPADRRRRRSEQKDRAEQIAGEQGAGWFGRKWARLGAPHGKITAPSAADSAAGAKQAADAGLKVKPGDVTQGGSIGDKTLEAAKLIQGSFGGFDRFTSLKDAYHTGFPGSDHNQGLAFDFTTNPAPRNEEESTKMKEQIIALLTKNKLKPRYVGDEYFKDVIPGRTTGGHFHVSLPKLAKGGITTGTSIAGEAGPEAVIPLPDGRTVPVKMDGIGELVEKFDEMIRVMKDHKSISEKHLRADT